MKGQVKIRNGQPRYCIECGAEMEITDFFIDAYNPLTGKKDKMVELRCPKGWWFWRHHSHFALVDKVESKEL